MRVALLNFENDIYLRHIKNHAWGSSDGKGNCSQHRKPEFDSHGGRRPYSLKLSYDLYTCHGKSISKLKTIHKHSK